MRVCFLSSTHPPLDKRVFAKEGVALAAHGFDVVHLAPDRPAREWVQDNVRIVTFRRGQGMWARLGALPRLFWLALRQRADCYHCNEVDSWAVGVLLKLVRRTRLVFDVHEHYPSDFAERVCPGVVRPFGGALMRFGFRCLTPFTDRLVFAKKHLAEDFTLEPGRQVLVENFASRRQRGRPPERAGKADGVTVIHLGTMSRDKGWPQLIEALTLARTPGLRVRLVGSFADDDEAELRARVERLGLAERVTREDWMPFVEAYRRVLAADIGVVTLQPGPHNHTVALPHKVFDYMVAGLPVVVPAFAREVAEIVSQSDCGRLVDTSNPRAIAAALDELASDPEARARLGANGRKAVLERYNWEGEAAKLVQMYRELLGQPRSHPTLEVPIVESLDTDGRP